VRASKADWSVLPIADRENQATGCALDQSVSAITRFTVLKTIVVNDRVNTKIYPMRQRYAVFRPVNRILRRIEISHFLYIQFAGVPVKPGNGAMS
jgi:hypothetical protein